MKKKRDICDLHFNRYFLYYIYVHLFCLIRHFWYHLLNSFVVKIFLLITRATECRYFIKEKLYNSKTTLFKKKSIRIIVNKTYARENEDIKFK